MKSATEANFEVNQQKDAKRAKESDFIRIPVSSGIPRPNLKDRFFSRKDAEPQRNQEN